LQFFGVVAVGAIVLVFTAALMTQKPVWMTGQVRFEIDPNLLFVCWCSRFIIPEWRVPFSQEASLGILRPFTEAPPPPPVT
jgi:hypothetical protein